MESTSQITRPSDIFTIRRTLEMIVRHESEKSKLVASEGNKHMSGIKGLRCPTPQENKMHNIGTKKDI
jgi:hypothetical protein